jgi:peroxiredoxin
MALGYRELAERFAAKNITIFGLHDGSITDAREWVDKHQLPFAVLNDPGRLVGFELGMAALDGEKYVKDPSEGRRPAVVIGEDGLICAWEPDMTDVTHIANLVGRL